MVLYLSFIISVQQSVDTRLGHSRSTNRVSVGTQLGQSHIRGNFVHEHFLFVGNTCVGTVGVKSIVGAQ